MRAVLTDIIIRQAKEGTIIWDRAAPSLGIRIGKNKRTWVRKVNGTFVTLGHYPTMTLKAARTALDAPDVEDEAELSFVSLLTDYRRIYLPTVAPRTSKEWDRLLTKHFSKLPSPHKLTTRDVYRITETLKPSEANHAVVAIRRMLNWARQTGRIQNRIELSKPNKEKSRERVLTLDELARVWKASDDMGIFGDIVKLLVLTGQRRGEVATIHLCTTSQHLQSESSSAHSFAAIDTRHTSSQSNQLHFSDTSAASAAVSPNSAAGVLSAEHRTQKSSLSDSVCASAATSTPETVNRMHQHAKTDRATSNTITWPKTKNSKPHTIPLTPYASALIASLVPSLTTLGVYSAWSKPKAALDKKSGVSDWTLHDLRRSFSTHAVEQLKIDIIVIEKILNHTMKGVMGIYNRATYMQEMIDALNRWEQFVLHLVGCTTSSSTISPTYSQS